MIRRFCCLAMLLAAAGAAPAFAAPQPLGLVATSEPVPMQCDGNACTALLSAFCLQQGRLPPDHDTAYLPAAGTGIRLVVADAEGRTRQVDATGLVEYRSRYGFTALEARLSAPALAGFGAVSAAIEVAPRAAMLPRATAGDPDPLTDTEIALVTGPWRLVAETILEGHSDGARTARVTAALINALPRSGDIERADRTAVWARIADGDATPRARHAFEACGRAVDQAVGYSLRKCLEERHELLQVGNTRAYWDSLAGS